ncbi:hypothetical protein Syun_015388 [Stephania yunnanensis]|uniref:Ricin B lectin domain-containing protein n=1 Tax=Stephania yunnanensis TaxID=152371 RepID=A0AAP0P9B3_9MAGN
MSYTGELLNAYSGLALTAKDGIDPSKLTLEERDDSSFQTWKATNKLTPIYVFIHGKNNQCISYENGYRVYTETCNSQASNQEWILFPDGTIRPIEWLDGCIEIASLSSAANTISIQAGRCSESPELHKWVFSHDGAIRNWKSQKVIDASETKAGYLAMESSGTTPGSSVVIHECETLDDTALRWAMSYTGELVNAHSGLALTAKDGTSTSKLTLEENDSSSFQTWKTTNKLTPVDAYIHGQNNQCIYYNGRYGVYTETCSKGSSTQQWRLYPDGTIRPINWLDGCIEIASLSSAENTIYIQAENTIYIQAGYCSGSPELHEWVFSNDGAIRNWKSQKVIDMSETEAGYLVPWDFHGGMNQIWTLEYV